jgi:hypothetical protein
MFQLSANFYEMSNIKKIKIQIEKHDFWAMFTVKHGLPYKSYVKGDNKGKHINGLQLLHIIMMFNIGQFIFCLLKFSILPSYIHMILIQQHIWYDFYCFDGLYNGNSMQCR